MTTYTSREIRLASYPTGLPTEANFQMATVQVEPLQAGQVLVRNLFMSVDPYMRGRMSGRASYVSAFEAGQPLNGGAVGEVVESRSDRFKPGDAVLSMYGWREMFAAPDADLQKLDAAVQPLSLYLGALGMPGLTAWVGLNLVDTKAGDIVFVSGAAGAVGSIVGQIAKQRGCTVIGSAGTPQKTAYLKELGFDQVFCYRDAPTAELLPKAAPSGIDVYFDNVGGETLEAAISSLRTYGRIAACGSISAYNSTSLPPGPSNMFMFVTKRLTMKGFIVSDHFAQQPQFITEVGGYFKAGKLLARETVLHGIDRAPEAFIGLFTGENTGKMIVDLQSE